MFLNLPKPSAKKRRQALVRPGLDCRLSVPEVGAGEQALHLADRALDAERVRQAVGGPQLEHRLGLELCPRPRRAGRGGAGSRRGACRGRSCCPPAAVSVVSSWRAVHPADLAARRCAPCTSRCGAARSRSSRARRRRRRRESRGPGPVRSSMYGSVTCSRSPSSARASSSAAPRRGRRRHRRPGGAERGSGAPGRAPLRRADQAWNPSLGVARPGGRVGRREHGVAGGAEFVLARRRGVVDPVLASACAFGSSSVGKISPPPCSTPVTSGLASRRLCEAEPMTPRPAPSRSSCTCRWCGSRRACCRIGQVDVGAASGTTRNAPPVPVDGVVAARAGAGVGRDRAVQRDLQLGEEDRVDALLEVGERRGCWPATAAGFSIAAGLPNGLPAAAAARRAPRTRPGQRWRRKRRRRPESAPGRRRRSGSGIRSRSSRRSCCSSALPTGSTAVVAPTAPSGWGTVDGLASR